MRAVVVTVVVALLFSSGCAARRNTAGSDGGADATVVTVLPTSEPVQPTYVPPNGPCAVQVNLPEPATTTTTPPAARPTGSHTPDVAPHNAENNGWKVRKGLSPEARQAGATAAEKIKQPLAALCGAGDFALDPTRKALADQGFADATVQYVRTPVGMRELAPGVFFALEIGAACVLGDLTPGSLRLSVDGHTGENSCVEPFSH
ncbi:hypothetical protein [Lentzea aerocolonigenes]|uniref:hypothetical protein n=1 Tax=Lentzea aerocolonigenes TaxID=68170 RepID=UPI0004C3B557|nr:hypothetical protein [Lentzea aerocolonigenes]MCP2242632.1 hypothetical protein [Lentzea aerocolonigenes]